MILCGAKGKEVTNEMIESIRKVGKAMKGLVAVAERGTVKETLPQAVGG